MTKHCCLQCQGNQSIPTTHIYFIFLKPSFRCNSKTRESTKSTPSTPETKQNPQKIRLRFQRKVSYSAPPTPGPHFFPKVLKRRSIVAADNWSTGNHVLREMHMQQGWRLMQAFRMSRAAVLPSA